MSRREWLGRIMNWLLVAVTVWMGSSLIWSWLRQDTRIGTAAPEFQAMSLTQSLQAIPPRDGRPSIVIFWATWCGPCRMELSRLAEAISTNELPADRIFAISEHESLGTVKTFASEHQYKFNVLADESGAGGEKFKVRVTPTIFHLDKNGMITWVAEGLHPLSISKARAHLN